MSEDQLLESCGVASKNGIMWLVIKRGHGVLLSKVKPGTTISWYQICLLNQLSLGLR